MYLARMAVRRVVQLLPILFGITLVSFFLLRLIPGDPVRQILGSHYTPDLAGPVRKSLGLDLPVWEQYWDFLRSALTGGLGHSYFYNQPVSGLIGQRIGATLSLIILSALFTAALSIPLGMVSGMRRGGAVDQSTRVFLLIGFAVPSFLLGIVLLLVFAVKVPVFPVSGYGDGLVEHLSHLFLPAVTLAIPFSTVLVRSLRSSVIDILDSDFVTTARLKGISGWQVAIRHVLRNGIVAVITVFGVNLAFLVGGTVIVEKVFAIPGIGTLLVDSVSNRDYPVVQALTLLFAVFVVAVNLLTDVVHVGLDPRLAADAR
ncbi:MAG TPA: ABC transporter permease [Nocardioidaceae bacterium]|nr:ABC transporter permease [Nocardioidaceae bacterium]